MTDVLIYWRDYKQNWIRQFAGDRAWFWHSNARLLGEFQPGDHLWMVTSGVTVATVFDFKGEMGHCSKFFHRES